jgi:hypothetical protein
MRFFFCALFIFQKKKYTFARLIFEMEISLNTGMSVEKGLGRHRPKNHSPEPDGPAGLSGKSPPSSGPQRSATPSGSSEASEVPSSTSPISLSNSPDAIFSAIIQHQGTMREDYLFEIDMLKKKLLAESKLRRHAEEMLANVVNKDDRGMLAHCKGLEKKLAREQKKTRALEAINESLRHQLARQTCSSVKVCNAETLGESHASMPVPGVTQPLFECPLNGLHTGNSTMVAYSVGGRRGTDVFAPVQKDIRTWTRLTSSGVVSPCPKDIRVANQGLAAEVLLQRVVEGQYLPKRRGVNASSDAGNDRSISRYSHFLALLVQKYKF